MLKQIKSFFTLGELEISGGDIVIESVSRHHGGTYQCVTRDDYGLDPVTQDVELLVECKLLPKESFIDLQ